MTYEGIDLTAFVDVTHFTMFYKALIIMGLFWVFSTWHEQCLTIPRL